MEWREETLIPTHIEVVWEVFQDKNSAKLDPSVTAHTLIEGKEDSIGAKHVQTYVEGKKKITAVVETVLYKDEPNRKIKEIIYKEEHAFSTKLRFELIKLNENETQLIFEGNKEPVNLKGKLKMKFTARRESDRSIQHVVQCIRRAAGA
ncbi:hypothetical protein [Alkalicoccus daliensis]|uniref:Polyketide cyclase / dehydrase and lipid transport n=1 Tax=Alkalicoccus daliensis TaxID=745820 RepID=A0A1H0FYX8_9BACI|nr:hypothetical protein [Alkalicoccus daliensis]SDN99878.1 hypothetical protein SAMN04488053_105161 [Alkalicoccus daliensis]